MRSKPRYYERRQILKLGTVLSMTSLISACSSTPTQPQAAPARHSALPLARLVALGGPMLDASRVQRGVAALGAMGFAVDNQACLTRRWSRFAGSDAERAADLNALVSNDAVMADILIATRGGYGAVRLLEHLDYARLGPCLKANGTMLMGYSDNTAVQLALLARAGVVSLSGPMLYGDFAAHPLSAFTFDHLRQLLSSSSFTLRVDAPQRSGTVCEGTLWGGNLTVLTSLAGTPWLPQIRGGILFLEDIGEDIYRVERMLQQLRLAGVLGAQSAILLGHFSGQRPDGFDPDGYTMDSLAAYMQAELGLPVLTGLPVGHVHDIASLPIGADARLVAAADGFTLEVSGYPPLNRLPAAFVADPAAPTV